MGESIQCWQCGTRMTLDELASNDGDCPRCEVEVHLAEYLDNTLSKVAALEAERNVLDLLCQERFDELAMLKAENAKLRAELERLPVDGWKLVPVEPTPEMVSAAEEAYMPFGDMDIALRMAILSALSAPATAQGGVYSTDPLACSGCVSGCFRCRSVKVQGDGWIPVSERLPESERTVLAFYLNSHGKGRRVRAEYIAAKTKSADDGWDSDEPADYDEQADEYFWPADWYEVMDNWDDLTHMVIHEGEVTHWMPLPAAPGAAPSAPKAGSGIYADDPLACNGCVSGCFRCRTSSPKADQVKVQLLEALEELMYAHTDKAEALATAAIAAARKEGGKV